MNKINRLLHRCLIFLIGLILPLYTFAAGNYPESSTCAAEKPHYAICISSRHSLAGWTGQCYATEKEAQEHADRHAEKFHKGNTRWVGVKKVR